MNNRSRYIIFAGVNGAGKSTLYRSNQWVMNEGDEQLPRVNPDEILNEFGGTWSSFSDQIKAGKIALRRIEQHFEQRDSFNQETTLCGRYIKNAIQKAVQLGYEINVIYVGVSSAQIALNRIDYRILFGGHGVDEARVEKRYQETLRNLIEIAPYCSSIRLYDNTFQMRLVMYSENKKVYRFEHGDITDMWYGGVEDNLMQVFSDYR